jgi:hypothetical protein
MTRSNKMDEAIDLIKTLDDSHNVDIILDDTNSSFNIPATCITKDSIISEEESTCQMRTNEKHFNDKLECLFEALTHTNNVAISYDKYSYDK